MRTSKLFLATIALAALATPAAAAEMLKFKLTGDLNASWIAPRSPVPEHVSEDVNFRITIFLREMNKFATFVVYDDSGILIYTEQETLFDGLGAVIMTGTASDPTFRKGVFTFFATFGPDPDSIPPQPGVPGRGTLTVSSIPEPASWALMIAGFGLTGSALRRRQAVATA